MMRKRKRVMQSVERDKTWAEKIELANCRCGHSNTIHAGGIWGCAFGGCTCQEFRERIASEPPPKTFRQVKEIMHDK